MTYSLKDYIFGYVKGTGLVFPTPCIWRPFGKVLEVDRCDADGDLVTNSQASLSRHVGHQMRGPIKINIFELMLIWFRIIT